MERAILHGLGEPLFNRDLPVMIRHLKERGIEALFNSNGTLLTARLQEQLVRSGLDEWERGLLYLPVLQRMAYHRAMAKGLDPDRPNNLTAVVEL